MLSAREFLRNRLQAVIEECGGTMSNETHNKLDELVEFVADDPESNIEPVSDDTHVPCPEPGFEKELAP